ncbi:MAG: BPSS1780 family membrane protein, partial [Pseudomonadota bacterium]
MPTHATREENNKMTDNPYAAPDANVDPPPLEASEHGIQSPRSVAAGRGWEWIAGGFRYFTASPGVWIGAVVAWALIFIVLAFIPLINLIGSVITPPIVAGFMIACDAQDRGRGFAFGDAFAGFQKNTGQLLLAGALYLGGTLALGIVAGILLVAFGGIGALAGMATGDVAGAGV